MTRTKKQERKYEELLLRLPNTPRAPFFPTTPPSASVRQADTRRVQHAERGSKSGIPGGNLSAVVESWQPFASNDPEVSTSLLEPISLKSNIPSKNGSKSGVPGGRLAFTSTHRRSSSSPEAAPKQRAPISPKVRGGGKVGVPGAPLHQAVSPNRSRRSTRLLAPISLKRKAASTDHASPPGPRCLASATASPKDPLASPAVHPALVHSPLTPRNCDGLCAVHSFPHLIPTH
ncbi:hypothetical protein C8F04DRAFT_523620 [Mycena alexandri]|uniref:Uncharacterized protein n=1 Tax=Mycena alexandri TaxID=1745969 RepID=A0AAD6XCP4_9AGAR|nr:hypothetical protein C8F04DRAFT_523620 [Mycena alexandri]